VSSRATTGPTVDLFLVVGERLLSLATSPHVVPFSFGGGLLLGGAAIAAHSLPLLYTSFMLAGAGERAVVVLTVDFLGH
jgi:hypothetical protein